MMMILGMFVFSLSTLAYHDLQRQTDWKHPSNAIVGGRDMSQFTGKGEDTITLNGWIAPRLAGIVYSLDALRFMADSGKAWFLIQGTGRIYGTFVITSMTESKTELANNGNPERISFSLVLKRVDQSVPDMLNNLGDLSSIKSMMSLDGMANMANDLLGQGKTIYDNVGNSIGTLR
jgi:hypothetical protein